MLCVVVKSRILDIANNSIGFLKYKGIIFNVTESFDAEYQESL